MIVGHERTIRYLSRALTKGTLAHAYLFYGPEAVGKRTVARALAGSVLCEEHPPAFGGCGTCTGCRLFAAGRHPDFIRLSSDERLVSEDTKEIGIASIRELARLAALSPWRGGRKVALLDGADSLSVEAQSAFLKTLEEPSGGTIFLLVTARPEALLPTIRSRAVPLSFTPVSDEALAPLLGNAPSGKRNEVLRLASGRPGLGLALLADEKLAAQAREDLTRLERLLGADLAAQFSFVESVAREPGAVEGLLSDLLVPLRRRLHEALVSGAERARPIARAAEGLLSKLAIAESTSVNRRLIADGAFVDIACALRRTGL